VLDEPLPRWRRGVVAVLRRRPRWATAYARRQVRLADEHLAASANLVAQVETAADAVDATPVPRLAQRHRVLRVELLRAVQGAERRLARSGSYQLERAGLVGDPAVAHVISYVADEVRPALAAVDAELAATAEDWA
jgi:hypothetical protein